MNLIKYKKRILIFGLAFLLLPPFNLAMGQEESGLGIDMEEESNQVSEEVIKNKAAETARQIETYLKLNPDKTIVELQADLEFKKIAVQRIADTGYTAVIDANNGYFYFHPQEKLLNTDSHQFKDSLPAMWAIFDKTIGPVCQDADGYYDWQEEDKTMTKKYMYLACVGAATGDGKNLFVGATAYLDEQAADRYLEEYNIKKSFIYAKDAIKQKAEDVARQIEIYIKLNPDKTVKDLQADQYFQEIAVQGVGKTGYTAVTDYETLTCRFHSNPTIVDLELHNLAEKLPGFWSVMSKTKGGIEAEGIYDWEEADGSMREKYMYISLVDANTADGVGLHVAATTYLDEYIEVGNGAVGEKDRSIVETQAEREKKYSLEIVMYWFLGGLFVIFLVLFTLNKLGIVKIERSTAVYLLAIVLLMIIGLFIFSTWQTTQNMKKETAKSAAEALSAVAVSRAEHINTLLDSYKIVAETLAAGNPFRDILDENIGYDLRVGQVKRRMRSVIESNSQISGIRVLDRHGKLIISSMENDAVGNEDVFIKAKEKSFIGEARISTRTGQKVMNISSPILLTDKFVGVMAVTFKLDELKNIVKNTEGLGKTGEIYLINKEKYTITPLRFRTDTFLKQKIDTLNSRNCFEHASGKGYEEVIRFVNYKGVNVVGVHGYLLETEWCLLAERDEQEIMVSVNKNISRTWYFTFGVIGLIILIGIVFNFLLTGSLRKEVADKTAELSIALVSMKKDQKELERQRLATLNILDDVSDSKEELEELNKKLGARGSELSALKALSDDLTSVLDVEEVVVIANSYFDKFIDFNTINYLIINPAQDGSIIYDTYSKKAVSEKYIKESKKHLANFLSLQKDTNLKAAVKIIKNIEPKYYGVALDNTKKDKPVGFEYYYLSISEKQLGVIQVVHREKRKIGKDELSLVRAIVTTLSLSIDRLQTLVLAQHSKTASLVESLTDGVIMFNDKEEIVLMNPAFSAYTGFSREYFNMKDLYKLLAEHNIQTMVKKAIDKGETSHINEVVLVRRYYEMFITPVRDNKEQIVGGAIIFHDITYLKEINKMKTEFVAVASHQLRTPLTAIKLFTDMMLRGETGKMSKEQNEYLENVNESTERMVRLVNDLLNVTRIESGHLRVEPQEIEVKNFLKNIIAEAKPLAINRQQKINYSEKGKRIPKVMLDQNLMRQVFHNLIVNAIRYSPKRTGIISITLKQDKKDSFVVVVHDNGIGIPKKAQKRIFEKFYRADNAIKSITEGTGLGLYVSKMIVESSGGKIWFESAKGRGSSFYVRIPIKGMKRKKGERGLAIS